MSGCWIGADALAHAAVSFARPDWRWGTDYDSDRAIATAAGCSTG